VWEEISSRMRSETISETARTSISWVTCGSALSRVILDSTVRVFGSSELLLLYPIAADLSRVLRSEFVPSVGRGDPR